MKKKLPPTFQNRWLITGTFTTESELHIGDAGEAVITDRSRPAKGDESDASTVCVDHNERAYIPGSAIKGVLRERVRSSGMWDSTWEHLLGSDSPDAKDAVGGKLEFWDAFFFRGTGPNESTDDRNRPFWNHQRRTCVAVSVSLDRRTRTASDQLLYHIEYLPAGESFTFEISGQNLSDETVARVLHLLDTFNTPNSQRTHLGAQASNSWGQITSEVTAVSCFYAADLAQWRANPTVDYFAPSRRLDPNLLRAQGRPFSGQGDALNFDLVLQIKSPWLVRDPKQQQRVKDYEGPQERKPADAVPLLDEDGRPFDPAKAFRGVLRTRAEMILRTIGVEVPEPARQPVISAKKGETAAAIAKVAGCDAVAHLFGLSGWRAPMEFTRFSLVEGQSGQIRHQEYVAIDRATGGAAEQLKFNADLATPTYLSGRLSVDLQRLRQIDPQLVSIGLLALVLRDLTEGDLTLGSGGAKGYGFFTADARIAESGETFGSLREWFTKSRVLESAMKAFTPDRVPS